MAEKTVNITLETLFDFLRREKLREELQKLPGTFYDDLIQYLNEKKTLMDSQQKSLDLFTEGDKERSLIQYNNIKRMVRELYEKRERKIINMALNKSKTNTNLIDTSSMLDEERVFYEEILYVLNKFRQDIALNLIEGMKPMLRKIAETDWQSVKKIAIVSEPKISEDWSRYSQVAESNLPQQDTSFEEHTNKPDEPQINENALISDHQIQESANFRENPSNEEAHPHENPKLQENSSFHENEERNQELKDEENTEESQGTKMIRFISPVPKFVGEELEVYGPFEEDDVANLPERIASLLIKKGRAEELSLN